MRAMAMAWEGGGHIYVLSVVGYGAVSFIDVSGKKMGMFVIFVFVRCF